MEKIIKIDGKELRIKASAATLVHYRNEFGTDMLDDLYNPKKLNASSVIEKSVYIMAKDAGENLPTFDEWLEGFALDSFTKVIKAVVNFWNESSEGVVKPKKKEEQPKEK